MPDVLHWLGIARIDGWGRWQHETRGAHRDSGIAVVERCHPRRAHPRRCAGGDGCQEGRGLLRAAASGTPGADSPRVARSTMNAAVRAAVTAGCGVAHAGADSIPPARLLTARRARACAQIMAAAERGQTRHLAWHPERLAATAAYVAGTIRQRYPDLDVPYHSRWRHFEAAGVDRWADARGCVTRRPRRARAHADRSRDRPACCSTPCGAGVALCRCRDRGRPSRAPKGSAWRVCACSRPGRSRLAARRRAKPMRGAGGPRHRHAGEGIPGGRGQSADGPRRTRRAAAPAGRRRGGHAGGVRHAGPARPPLRLPRRACAGGRGRRRIPAGHAAARAGPHRPPRQMLDGVALGDCWRHPAARAANPADPTDGYVPFHKPRSGSPIRCWSHSRRPGSR